MPAVLSLVGPSENEEWPETVTGAGEEPLPFGDCFAGPVEQSQNPDPFQFEALCQARLHGRHVQHDIPQRSRVRSPDFLGTRRHGALSSEECSDGNSGRVRASSFLRVLKVVTIQRTSSGATKFI